jgi:ribonuclease HII
MGRRPQLCPKARSSFSPACRAVLFDKGHSRCAIQSLSRQAHGSPRLNDTKNASFAASLLPPASTRRGCSRDLLRNACFLRRVWRRHSKRPLSAKYWKRLSHECDLWQKGLTLVAGVDEAGCGPLAGPVVAAAVVFPCAWLTAGLATVLRGLNDSKQLTEEQREKYYAVLTTHPDIGWAVASVDVEVIDRINILQAAHRAMNLALAQLQPPPEHVLVDGRRVKTMALPHTALVQGDARSYSIAGASVIAKVTRDRTMLEFDRLYPGYGFAEHKGYGTPQHLAAIQALGPCPIHRRSFAPFRPVELELFPPEATASSAAPPPDCPPAAPPPAPAL